MVAAAADPLSTLAVSPLVLLPGRKGFVADCTVGVVAVASCSSVGHKARSVRDMEEVRPGG
jgi:hypothetical protein